MSATRAEYGPRHLERLRLISALREVGDLPVSAIQQIIAAIEDDRVACTSCSASPGTPSARTSRRRRTRTGAPPARTSTRWSASSAGHVGDRAPARDLLAHTFVALRRLGFPITLKDLRPYVRAAAEVAEHEIGRVSDGMPRARAVQSLLVSTVLYEQVLTALHRLAQEDASSRRFGRN